MRVKTDKGKHVVMFSAASEFYAYEVPDNIEIVFFVYPPCVVKVYHKKDHFFSRDYEQSCDYVQKSME